MSEPQINVPGAEAEPAAEGMFRRWLRRTAATLIILLGAPLLLATLLSLLSPAAWWLDLITHFRPQLALGLLVAMVLQLLVSPRVLAAAWGMGAALNLFMLAPLWLAWQAPVTGPELTVAHANVAGDDVDVEALADWIAQKRPDLLSLQEITPRNLPRITQSLAAAGLDYALAAAQPREDTRGVALFSRREGVQASVIYPTPDSERPMIEARLDLGDVPVAVLGFHTTRPAPARPYRFQAQGMSGAALWCRVQGLAEAEHLLIGDFNSTAQGSLVSDLCQSAGLRDARRGNGLAGTWPAHLPGMLRIPIDGAYHSEGLVSTSVETGRDIGSDHLPLLVRLRVRQR